jgi:hypothetical protein
MRTRLDTTGTQKTLSHTVHEARAPAAAETAQIACWDVTTGSPTVYPKVALFCFIL